MTPWETLKGARVSLRKSIPEDVDTLMSLGRDPQIFEMFGVNRSDLKPVSKDEAEKWVADIDANPYCWIIDAGGLIGEVRLHKIDANDRRASFAIGILDPQKLGNGYGTEASLLVLDFAFSRLKLHRLGLRVLAHNIRAIRSYQKCGFRIEGKELESAFINGKWHDDIIMGLLDWEFSKVSE